jgi:hypothetical protein
MDLECQKCGFAFKGLAGYQYHVDKNVCDGKSHFCDYCGKGYTTSNSMYRHRKRAHTNKEEDSGELQESVMTDFLKDYEDMKQRVLKMEKTMKHGTTNIFKDSTVNINNGTIDRRTLNITNTNNITIVAYGKEDMNQIDREDIIKALKTGFNSTKHLTEVIHFNPKYPNYSNIKRSNYNMKNKIMYHNGSGWVTTSDPHMIDDLYNRKRDFIEDNIEHYQDALTKGDMTRLQRWLDVDDDDQRITRIKTDLREMLFNKKHVAEMNENSATVQFVTLEDLDSIEDETKVSKEPKNPTKQKKNTTKQKIVVESKKKKLAGRPGTKRKTVRIVRNNK